MIVDVALGVSRPFSAATRRAFLEYSETSSLEVEAPYGFCEVLQDSICVVGAEVLSTKRNENAVMRTAAAHIRPRLTDKHSNAAMVRVRGDMDRIVDVLPGYRALSDHGGTLPHQRRSVTPAAQDRRHVGDVRRCDDTGASIGSSPSVPDTEGRGLLGDERRRVGREVVLEGIEQRAVGLEA